MIFIMIILLSIRRAWAKTARSMTKANAPAASGKWQAASGKRQVVSGKRQAASDNIIGHLSHTPEASSLP
jgi:hypothetical protein